MKWTLRLVLVFTILASMLSAQGIREPISNNTGRQNSSGSAISLLQSAGKDLEMARNLTNIGTSAGMQRCGEMLKAARSKLERAAQTGSHYQNQEIGSILQQIEKIRFSVLQSDSANSWKAIDKILTDVNKLIFRSVANESRASVMPSRGIPEPISTNTGRRSSSGSAANAGLASSLQKATQSLEMARNLTSNDSDAAKKRTVGLLNEAGTVLLQAKRGAAAYQASEIDSLLKQITEARALVLSGKDSAAAWKMIDRIISNVKKLAFKAVTYE